MSANAIVPGPTSEIVRRNIRRLRKARSLTIEQLADLMRTETRYLWPQIVSKIERGARRIDVDDLMAFSVALGVEPAVLLSAPACEACNGAPPAGLACLACGTGAAR